MQSRCQSKTAEKGKDRRVCKICKRAFDGGSCESAIFGEFTKPDSYRKHRHHKRGYRDMHGLCKPHNRDESKQRKAFFDIGLKW